jgi:hypothetical protein
MSSFEAENFVTESEDKLLSLNRLVNIVSAE